MFNLPIGFTKLNQSNGSKSRNPIKVDLHSGNKIGLLLSFASCFTVESSVNVFLRVS